MRRRELISTLMLSAGLAALLPVAPAALAAPGSDLYARCAKACADSAKACQTCHKHCEGMVNSGKKEHEKTLALSADCMDICALAAKLCERKGPLAVAMCETCIKACQACGSECAKYPKMAPMAECAKSCATCVKVCQEMVAAGK